MTLERDTYIDYKTYLKTRQNDKQICNLIKDIVDGNIPIKEITKDADSKNLIISGDVKITDNLHVTSENNLMIGEKTLKEYIDTAKSDIIKELEKVKNDIIKQIDEIKKDTQDDTDSQDAAN